MPKESMAGDTYADFIHQAAGMLELLKSWQPIVIPIKDAEAWSSLALAYFRLGREKDALTCVDHAIVYAPSSPHALAVRAHLQLKQRKLENAWADLQKADADNSNDFLLQSGRARYHELKGDWELSLGHYQKLDRFAKVPWQHVEATLGQARVLQALGRIEDAKSQLKSIEQLAPRTTSTASKKILAPAPVKANP